MSHRGTSKELDVEENTEEDQDGGVILLSSQQQPIQENSQSQHDDMRDALEDLTMNDRLDHHAAENRFQPDGVSLQQIGLQLTVSEHEAMIAHAHRLVDTLVERGHFRVTIDPQAQGRRISVGLGERNDCRTAREEESALIPRADLFRNIATRLTALRQHTASSEWETIDSASENCNTEDLEPKQPFRRDEQSDEAVLNKAARATEFSTGMAYHLDDAEERLFNVPSAAFRTRVRKEHDSLPNVTTQSRLKPRILVHSGEGGPEFYPVSPIPINYGLARSGRRSTPSIYSNGSELDCSSPLFLKSCEAAVRSRRDLGQLCGDLPVPNARRKISSSSGLSSDARIMAWLDGIDVEEELKARSETAFPTKVHHGPREANLTEVKTTSEELTVSALQSSRRALNVLRDESTRGSLKDPLPSGRATPNLEALKDISNLQRPGYLTKNSFARPETISKKRATAPRHIRPVCATLVKTTHTPSPHNTPPRTVQRAACISPHRLNLLRKQAQTTALFSFEPRIPRRNHSEYALAILENHVLSPRILSRSPPPPPPPAVLHSHSRSKQPAPLQSTIRKRRRRRSSTAAAAAALSLPSLPSTTTTTTQRALVVHEINKPTTTTSASASPSPFFVFEPDAELLGEVSDNDDDGEEEGGVGLWKEAVAAGAGGGGDGSML